MFGAGLKFILEFATKQVQFEVVNYVSDAASVEPE